MRIAFLSDLQLGSGSDYGTPQRPRLQDHAEALEKITKSLVSLGVSDLVIAGDVFQHRRPGIDELVVFGRWLEALPFETIIVAGNHDVRGPDSPATVDLFGAPDVLVDRLVFTRPEVVPLPSRSLPTESVALAVLPWAHPGPLRAARDGATPLEQAAAMVEIAQGLRAEVAERYPDAIPVLVTHYALSGFSLPTGLSTGELIGEPVLDSHALAAQGWRFVFAGHVHKPAEVTMSGGGEGRVPYDAKVVSIGSPWIQDFGEAGERHGFWLLDPVRRTVTHFGVEGRRFVTLEGDDFVDVTALGSDGRDLVLSGRADIRDAVVRVRLHASEEGALRLNVDALKRHLYDRGAHKVFAVQLDVERSARARVEGMTEEEEPLAALDAWASSTGVEATATERLLELTSSLLTEVS